MTRSSRRAFVLRVLPGSAALLALCSKPAAAFQGLGQFAAGPPPCDPDKQPTPAAPQGPEYKAGSPERTSLREPGLAGTKLVLTGTVAGVTCGLIKRATVEFWQADAKGVYDMAGFRLRGRQLTDANGAYKLETIVPGAAPKHAPKLHVRVQPPGKPAFATQLFFPDEPSNKADKDFRPPLAMKVTNGADGRKATFNIVLDI